jgi:hypothetical protein
MTQYTSLTKEASCCSATLFVKPDVKVCHSCRSRLTKAFSLYKGETFPIIGSAGAMSIELPPRPFYHSIPEVLGRGSVNCFIPRSTSWRDGFLGLNSVWLYASTSTWPERCLSEPA